MEEKRWLEILRKDDIALLQSTSDTQYVLASGYNPKLPEGKQWNCGRYFPYWQDPEQKAKMLQKALKEFWLETNEFEEEENYE